MWFHLKCLGDVIRDDGDPMIDYNIPTNPKPLNLEVFNPFGFPAIMDEVLERPTVRGHGGKYNFDNNWLNTGSGAQQGMIKEWIKKEAFPNNWLERLGENFLPDFVIEKNWKFYACPLCGLEV
jgi:hypothetical protein